MKKLKKLLTAALAAVMTVSMSSVSAAAVDVPTVNRIDLSIKMDHNLLKPIRFVIAESGQTLWSFDPISCVIVKMADGIELEADESRYEIERLSKYQLKVMQGSYGFDGISDKDKDLNSIDDYYIVRFNKNNDSDNILKESEDRNLFCNELLESGMAEYVKPIMVGSFGFALPSSIINYLQKKDVDSSGFSNDLFGFILTFASAEDAQSFEPDSVADFYDNLHVSIIKDNVMYFQFNKEVKGKTMANVLCSLQNSEAVNNVGAAIAVMPINVVLLSVIPSGSIKEIPKDHPLGDTNYNDKIDLYDAINIAKHMRGIKELDELQQILADYNEDGKIDLYDAIGIAKYMAKKNKK